jgi:hypothetical protein
MDFHGSSAGGGALSTLRRQLHRVHRSNAEEGLRSSVFYEISTYVTGETRGYRFSYQVEVEGGDEGWRCLGGSVEAWRW